VIGNYLASNLHEVGYHVIGFVRTFPVKPNFENIICNVSIGENVQSVFSSFKKNKNVFGLIKCAGILHIKTVASIANNEISEIIDTNIKGTIYCLKILFVYYYRKYFWIKGLE